MQLLDDRDADAVEAAHDDVAGQLIGVQLDDVVSGDRAPPRCPDGRQRLLRRRHSRERACRKFVDWRARLEADGGGLENRYECKLIKGSNPLPSAPCPLPLRFPGAPLPIARRACRSTDFPGSD